jgi:flagellar biogenesis protein FliO
MGPDAPDASISERAWLGESAASDRPQALSGTSSASSGLTLGALIILLGLGSAAIVLHFKRRKTLPISKHDSRLDVISSSRIGPKAYAVTAHVGGRVMLLGVTDHNVTLLTWLDAEPGEDAAVPEEDEHADEADDDLAGGYPGSPLRQSAAPPSAGARPSSIHPKKPFATSHDLKRFQEVLRGAIHLKTELPLLRAPLSGPPSAASTLAAQTTDVVLSRSIAPRQSIEVADSEPPPPPAQLASVRPSAAPASLRRKRQRRAENAASRAKSKAGVSADSGEGSVEGQVAGLERLKGGSSP